MEGEVEKEERREVLHYIFAWSIKREFVLHLFKMFMSNISMIVNHFFKRNSLIVIVYYAFNKAAQSHQKSSSSSSHE